MGVSPLELVNLHRNRRYFVIKLHTWFCLSYFLKTNITFYCIYQYFMSINSFFNTVSVSRYSRPITVTPWPRLARSISFFLIMLFNNMFCALMWTDKIYRFLFDSRELNYVFCRYNVVVSPFSFLFIVLSILLRYTVYGYLFGIFKLVLHIPF